jgi:3'-5' exoribonuclease
MLWCDHKLFADVEGWGEGLPYRLSVRGKHDLRYGLQLEILSLRPATDADISDGFDFNDLYESSKYPADSLFAKVCHFVENEIADPFLRQLVHSVLEENRTLVQRMPAAQNFHHSYTAGLLEHVWSMTRIAVFLADHYTKYYDELNPPLNKGIVVAAAILHDIGKLRELEYHPIAANYTKIGQLVGHVLIGRDIIRDAASRIDGFPEETLLLLEHAVLAHHGRREFGAPILPQTMEALLVSYIDDLDAKMNMVARERLQSTTPDGFTAKVYGLDNRRFYKGIPIEVEPADPIDLDPSEA